MPEIRETVGVYQRLGTAIIESNRVATTRRLNANRPSLDSSVDRSPEAVVPWKRPDETRRRRRIFVQKAKVNRGSPSSHNSNRRVASINSSASPTTRLVARPTINLTSLSPSSLFLSPPPSLSLSLNRAFSKRAFARTPPLLYGRVLRTRRPRVHRRFSFPPLYWPVKSYVCAGSYAWLRFNSIRMRARGEKGWGRVVENGVPPFPCMSRPFIPCYAISNAIEGMLFSRFTRGLTFIGAGARKVVCGNVKCPFYLSFLPLISCISRHMYIHLRKFKQRTNSLGWYSFEIHN